MKKVALIFGTRPEAIKMCPVINELKSRNGIKAIVCLTGQHREMLRQVLDVFHITVDYDLKIMSEEQTLFDVTEKVLKGVRDILSKECPDVVLVHGDTNTTFAAALASFYMGIPVGHVEAGFRTYNIKSPYPEEFNRQAVRIISKYNFAPTEKAKENLLTEKCDPKYVFVTGNTSIDALQTTIKKDYNDKLLETLSDKRIVLITAHRRENLGEPMRHMFQAIKRVLDDHRDVCAIYPMHMNPRVREIAYEIFSDCERVHLIEPLDVIDFHNYMNRSYIILTDSGGIQEEAPSLGKPVLVMRDTTERTEGILAGTLKLVGTSERSIYKEFSNLLDDENEYMKMSKSKNPYGDGKAAVRIADIICKELWHDE